MDAIERTRKRRRTSPVTDFDEQEKSNQRENIDFVTLSSQTPPRSHSDDDSAIEDVPGAAYLNASTVSRIKKAGHRTTLRQNIVAIPNSPNASSHFAALGLSPNLIHPLHALSITAPTPVQTATIPPILKGSDCIASSRTGSGKTLAFALPILNELARDPQGIFAVILTPTRELALQIYEQVLAVGTRMGVKCALVTGGADMRQQSIELSKRPHIVVATPGRLADHIRHSGEDTVGGLKRIRFVVLDEADRLLAPGKGSMLEAIETCFSVLPPPSKRQTLLFTATITPEVRALRDMPRGLDKPPVFVCELAGSRSEEDLDHTAIPDTLTQTYQLVNVVHKEKYLHVLLLTPANVEKNIIIFCNRRETATLLEYTLRLLDHRVTALHSGLRHEDRVSNLARFRARAARILVATDVAARGLDIPTVGLVVNYDLPRNPDDYIHRAGRTARAGRKGTCVSLVGQRDVDLVHAIEARVGRDMDEYSEEGVSVEGRVIREALNVVGEKKREALLNLEEGRDVRGKRVRRR